MNTTYEISTKGDKEDVFDIFEEKLIPYRFWEFGKFGYIGKVDRDKEKITIVDHMNSYFSGRGMRYRSKQQFVGTLERRNGLTYISGQFYLQPYYKLSYGLIFILFTLMLLPFAIGSHDLFVWIKLLCVYFAFIGISGSLLIFNMLRASNDENDTIDFIRGVMKSIDESME